MAIRSPSHPRRRVDDHAARCEVGTDDDAGERGSSRSGPVDGLTVFNRDGRERGSPDEVIETGSNELYPRDGSISGRAVRAGLKRAWGYG